MYNSNFLNTFSLLQKGMNESNAYSTLRNNVIFNQGDDHQNHSDEEKQKRKRIELLSFMSMQPRTWKFELSHQNPHQKKKVKDLPKPYQDQIILMDNTLRANRARLDQIKENNAKLKHTLGQKLKDTMDRNILSLKQINNQICRVSRGLENYTEEVRYFTRIVG